MWVLAHLQMNNGGASAHVQWFSHWKIEQTIIMSLCDVMQISHARKGREVYKESTTRPRGYCYCHLGIPVQEIWVH